MKIKIATPEVSIGVVGTIVVVKKAVSWIRRRIILAYGTQDNSTILHRGKRYCFACLQAKNQVCMVVQEDEPVRAGRARLGGVGRGAQGLCEFWWHCPCCNEYLDGESEPPAKG